MAQVDEWIGVKVAPEHVGGERVVRRDLGGGYGGGGCSELRRCRLTVAVEEVEEGREESIERVSDEGESEGILVCGGPKDCTELGGGVVLREMILSEERGLN